MTGLQRKDDQQRRRVSLASSHPPSTPTKRSSLGGSSVVPVSQSPVRRLRLGTHSSSSPLRPTLTQHGHLQGHAPTQRGPSYGHLHQHLNAPSGREGSPLFRSQPLRPFHAHPLRTTASYLNTPAWRERQHHHPNNHACFSINDDDSDADMHDDENDPLLSSPTVLNSSSLTAAALNTSPLRYNTTTNNNVLAGNTSCCNDDVNPFLVSPLPPVKSPTSAAHVECGAPPVDRMLLDGCHDLSIDASSLHSAPPLLDPMPPVLRFTTPFVHFLRKDYLLRTPNAIPSPPDPTPDLPNPFDDYLHSRFRIIDTLGSGAFATTYAVAALHSNDTYAIKKARHVYLSSKARARQLEEVRIMWMCGHHSHCVFLFDAWEQQGILYLQMELCLQTLESYLELHADEPNNAMRIWYTMADIAQGLAFLHDNNIVHLDIKPSNILITPHGTLKISDFGLAICLDATSTSETEGDRRYMAPELLLDTTITPAVDMFSFGLVLIEVAANCDVPDSGHSWRKLRDGDVSEVPFDECVSSDMVGVVKGLVRREVEERWRACDVLSVEMVRRVVKEEKERGMGVFTSLCE